MIRLRKIFFLSLFILTVFARAEGTSTSAPGLPKVFRISQTDLPKSLDPHRSRSSSGNFLSQQLYRNFFTFDDKNSYVPELGESCVKSKLKWTCKIKKDLKWSDGSALTAMDFVLSIRRIITLPSPRAELLFNLLNAKDVYDQKKKPDQLGIKFVDARTFEINWAVANPDNDLLLMSPLFVPLPGGQYKKDVFSGPYQLSDQNNQRLLLSPNRLYFKKNARPSVEFQIFEENLAVKAYEKGQLEFLRRVPTAQIGELEKARDFHWYSVLRFDSIAFGPELKDKLPLRKKLTENLKFEELQQLFHSPDRIGCPGLSKEMADDICYDIKKPKTFEKIKKLAAKAMHKQDALIPESLVFSYSTSGGDDHRRLGEWLQSQWQQSLNLKLSLQPLENKIFQNLVETKPPAIFRRGLNLEAPTCYNALKVFTTGNADNFIQFENPQFDDLVLNKLVNSNEKSSRKICTDALKILMDSYVLIPTGRIHFAIRVSPKWSGWKINQLNHLDLSELQYAP